MIKDQWLFIGTDKRLELCEKLMREEGRNCRYVKTDLYSLELENVLKAFQPTHIVFPILQMKDMMPSTFLQADVKLYTGIASKEWLAPLEEKGLAIQSYLKEELYVWENAEITAEAFLKEFYKVKHDLQ